VGKSLGKLGKRKGSEVVTETTFDWFDVEIHLSAKGFSELEYVDLVERANQIDDASAEAITLIKDLFRMLLADEATAGDNWKGFDTFWQLAKANDQGIEDLMAVYQVLMEALTARPTQRPSDSSGGPGTVTAISPPDSSSPASSGRPDLQVMREQAAEDRARVLAAVSG
jgi:hypothetical protein